MALSLSSPFLGSVSPHPVIHGSKPNWAGTMTDWKGVPLVKLSVAWSKLQRDKSEGTLGCSGPCPVEFLIASTMEILELTRAVDFSM